MKKNSLKSKVLLYLSIFTLVILGGIWFLQILSLDMYYEWNKKSEIKGIANKVLSAYNNGNYSDVLDSLAFKEDICIEITEDNNISYSTDSISRGCLINNSKEINNYKLKFMLSGDESIIYRVINPKFDNKTLIYGLKIDNGKYAFISTSLEPIGSTVSALKRQLVLIIIVVLLIAFLIAYTISKKISKPIENITKLSLKMSRGDYNIVFDSDTDIEEINELEKTLTNAARELSKTEELRRELLANVSHDLKTPLTLIKANAEMVKDLTYKDKDKRDKNLSIITEEVDRLNLLVEDILDLSKMQSNAVKLEIEEFNINEMINTIIERFNVLCDINGYKINYKGFDININADKKKMEQVIYNLINNAINYTGEDKNIYIELFDMKESLRVSIRDTGNGIDPKDIDYIWDKYYKVDKRYKRVTYGTGLGLSIVKNILILHKFRYGVESVKNNGTIFYFEIDKILNIEKTKNQKNEKNKKMKNSKMQKNVKK